MSNVDASTNPEAYMRENKDTLSDIVKHSDDEFTRALAIVFLVRHGDDPDPDRVRQELDTAQEVLE